MTIKDSRPDPTAPLEEPEFHLGGGPPIAEGFASATLSTTAQLQDESIPFAHATFTSSTAASRPTTQTTHNMIAVATAEKPPARMATFSGNVRPPAGYSVTQPGVVNPPPPYDGENETKYCCGSKCCCITWIVILGISLCCFLPIIIVLVAVASYVDDPNSWTTDDQFAPDPGVVNDGNNRRLVQAIIGTHFLRGRMGVG
jgi:hypothetical protein